MSRNKNKDKELSLLELLSRALDTTWEGYSIWSAKRGSNSNILDFEMIYSNEISNNPVKSITGKLLSKPISEVILNGDTERIRSVLRNALSRYRLDSKQSQIEHLSGWTDDTLITVLPLSSNEVFVGYQKEVDPVTIQRTQWIFEHDPLTGLIDQVLLEDLLNEALLNLDKTGENFSFGMLDIDDFYKVNLKHDREFGDLVLRKFAETFQSKLKSNDRLIRLGNDDFAVILRDISDLSEITSISKNLMAVTHEGWEINGNRINLNFSAGFVLVKNGFATTQEIFHLAESQMYKVKNHGKNGFVSSIFHGELVKK